MARVSIQKQEWIAFGSGKVKAVTRAYVTMQIDKVLYLRGMREIPNQDARRAELLLLQGKHVAAEEVLMSKRLLWAAIDLNIRLFSWERALAIAEQSDDPLHVQGVLWCRWDSGGCAKQFDKWSKPHCCLQPKTLLLVKLHAEPVIYKCWQRTP
jgi:hypothetical protein